MQLCEITNTIADVTIQWKLSRHGTRLIYWTWEMPSWLTPNYSSRILWYKDYTVFMRLLP